MRARHVARGTGISVAALLVAMGEATLPGCGGSPESDSASAGVDELTSAPTIVSVSPSSGAENMTPYPVIRGTNLQAGAKVYVNGNAARGVWPGGTTYLVFRPPLSNVLGPVDVEVVNPDGGTATLKGGFSYTTASSPPGGTPGTGNGDGYPRLGLISIGGPQQYASTFESFAARVHMVIIGGAWEGWQLNRGYGKEAFISGVKSQSKVHTRVFQYVNLNEVPFARSGAWFPTFWDKVNAMNWWLYDAGASGTKTPDWQDPANKGLLDLSAAAPRDPATGLGPTAWGARYVNDYYHLGQYAGYSAVPSLDGFFLDNVFVDPYVDGDWNRTGSSQSQKSASAQAAVMAGEKAFFDYLRSVWPTGIQIGNSGDGVGQAVSDGWSVAGLDGALQGSVLEHAIGKSYSIETWGGAAEMQRYYQSAMASLASPKLLVFSHGEVTSTGSDPTAYSGSTATSHSPAWQGMRYGLAAALMNDGYYFADVGTYDEETTANRLWFDEYDGAGLGVGYLGQPLSSAAGAPQTVAWTNGVWKREFDHGIALWNPKGNGTKTVSLSGLGNLKRLRGSQNPTTNSGAVVTNGTVTLGDRDGLILLRY